jgi:hypothetical protein
MTTVDITQERDGGRPEFRVASSSGEPFVLKSAVIVDAKGMPVWEFVRETYEMSDDVEIETGVIDVMTDSFREALQSTSLNDVGRTPELAARVHRIQYRHVPAGYKQSLPERDAPELTAGAYRLVVFSSLGGANLLFRHE